MRVRNETNRIINFSPSPPPNCRIFWNFLSLTHLQNLFSHPYFFVPSFNTLAHASSTYFLESQLTGSPCHDDISSTSWGIIKIHIFSHCFHTLMYQQHFINGQSSLVCVPFSVKFLTDCSQISYDSHQSTNSCYIQVPVNTVDSVDTADTIDTVDPVDPVDLLQGWSIEKPNLTALKWLRTTFESVLITRERNLTSPMGVVIRWPLRSIRMKCVGWVWNRPALWTPKKRVKDFIKTNNFMLYLLP